MLAIETVLFDLHSWPTLKLWRRRKIVGSENIRKVGGTDH